MWWENIEIFPISWAKVIKSITKEEDNKQEDNKIVLTSAWNWIFFVQESKYVKWKVGDILSK